MSLHHAAQHLKAQGRGPDDQLIHMSGSEVAGLQSLAMAHGGSLTINPTTGLPEAGFLDNILPTVIGAAGTSCWRWSNPVLDRACSPHTAQQTPRPRSVGLLFDLLGLNRRHRHRHRIDRS